MKNRQLKKFDHQIRDSQNFSVLGKTVKTTNINILLNRVRQENKNQSKKKIILSTSIIGMLSIIGIIVFLN